MVLYMRHKIILLSIICLFFTTIGASASVGAVPGFYDFGEVEPGQSYEANMYVTTNFDQNFTVNPEVRQGRNSIMFRDSREERMDTSEFDISDYASASTALVDPTTRQRVELDDGSSANAYGSFTVELDIPSDAEPGYHYGSLRLNPDIDTDGSGAGTVNWGETRVDMRFRVPGEAERDIHVQDVRAFRLGEDQAAVELLLTNEGTVTASTSSADFLVLDSSQSEKANLSISGSKLEPGESQWVEASWNADQEIEQGSYQIDGEIDYLTGNSYASGSFSLPDFDVVEVRPDDSPGAEEDEQESLPLWMVFMILVIMGVLMYSFNIDPFWILLIVGILGISAFILLSGVSNYLLVLLLMLVGIILYGGM